MTLAPLDRLRDGAPGQGRLDQLIDVARPHSQSRRALAVEADFDVGLAADRVGEDVDGAGHTLHDPRDLVGAADHVIEIPAEDADPHRRVHAGREHVHPVLDRHGPDVRPAGHLHRPVQLTAESDQLVATDLPEDDRRAESERQVGADRLERRLGFEWGRRRRLVRMVVSAGRRPVRA